MIKKSDLKVVSSDCVLLNRRPTDFKRKILKTNIDCKKKLLEEEYPQLQFIINPEI